MKHAIRVFGTLLCLTAFFTSVGTVQALPKEQVFATPNPITYPALVLSEQVKTYQEYLVMDSFYARIVQQDQSGYYVSSRLGEITQFEYATKYHTIGLLAHNGTMVGRRVLNINLGQGLYIVDSDGSFRRYLVTQILRYQALTPNSLESKFVEVDNNFQRDGETLSATELFNKIYTRSGFLVLQTCIPHRGDMNWGRIFIIAEPD